MGRLSKAASAFSAPNRTRTTPDALSGRGSWENRFVGQQLLIKRKRPILICRSLLRTQSALSSERTKQDAIGAFEKFWQLVLVGWGADHLSQELVTSVGI
jgi:hypothetical protein